MNPTRHVVFALAMAAVIYFAAGDTWNTTRAKFVPVAPVPKT